MAIDIPFGAETYQRRRADEPDIRFVNRYLEQDPTDQVKGVAALRRPGLSKRIEAGDGPIRRLFSQSGFANGAMFIFSKNQLLKLTNTPTEGDKLFLLDGFVYGHGNPSVDSTREHLFFADGVLCQYTDGTAPLAQVTYNGRSSNPARSTLRGTGEVSAAGSTFNVPLAAGAALDDYMLIMCAGAMELDVPDGWVVADSNVGTAISGAVFHGKLTANDVNNGFVTVNASNNGNGLATLVGLVFQGDVTDISIGQTFISEPGVVGDTNLDVGNVVDTDTAFTFAASLGAGVNATFTYNTTAVYSQNATSPSCKLAKHLPMASGAATESVTWSDNNNGTYSVTINTHGEPGHDALDFIVSSLTVLKSYVFLAVQNSDRIYWIEPGETTVDGLNFVTAEARPDIVVQLITAGDQFWALGATTTEPFYLTGVLDAPVAPVQGRPFDNGTWGGTAVKINDEIIAVGADGIVYSITDGAKPISTPGITERVQKAMKIQVLDL